MFYVLLDRSPPVHEFIILRLTLRQIQSIFKTPPRALALKPGGNTQETCGTSCLDSVESLAKPLNLPDSFTEKINNTFRDSSNALFSRLSLVGGVLHTPFALDNVTFSALLLLTRKNLASRNK